MANLSQQKRERMLAFLDTLKRKNADDDDMLRAIGEIENELNSKKYGLVWEKHEEAVDVKMKDYIPVFTEDPDREITATPGEDYNFLLEGDNLHSLKLLEKTHKGKIDVIYIDPPYNRGGKDFIYDDNFVDKEDGYRHSKWLSFMNERLKIAWNLLKDTGVIFISIDDFENAPLRMLCDDIFGEQFFLCTLVWQKRYSRENREAIGDAHEYILVYTKNKDWFKEHRHKDGITKSQEKAYKNPNNDPKGRWRGIPMTAQGYRPNQMYPITTPSGKVVYPPSGRCWSTVESNFKQLLAEGRIYFGKKGDSQPSIIRYLTEVEGVTPWTWWDNEESGHTDEAKKEIINFFGNADAFDTPKPTRLIKRIMKIASQKDSLILDFFAGSGTTAQSVLELNQEDGGNRHFILCTNNENNICENVTYPRVQTVITGIRPDGSRYSDGIPANLKYYKTDFVARNEEYLSDALLKHITEMIQLENGIKLDGKKYLMILTDEQADDLSAHWDQYPDVKAIYLSKNVLLTTDQESLFENIPVYIIPDYYFDFELREEGESW
ncbi:site-specific DNA-methyltransferase [Bacillota bacterium HCP3S3_F1_1]